MAAFIVGLPTVAMARAEASAAAAHHGVRGKASRHRRSQPKHVPTTMTFSSAPGPAVGSPQPQTADAGVPQGRPSVAGGGGGGSARCANGNLQPSGGNLAAIDAATLCLINRDRAAAGLAALAENADLDRAAAVHSAEMVSENYFDHVGPDGSTIAQRVLATGFVGEGPGGRLAENIAAGTSTLGTPAQTVAAWMRSSSHRANILDPGFTQTGIGASSAVPAQVGQGSGGTYTEDFA